MAAKQTVYLDDISERCVNKDKTYYSAKTLQTKYLHDVRFVPYRRMDSGTYSGGLVDTCNNYIEPATQSNELIRVPPLIQDIKKDTRTVVYLGCFLHHWGHFCIEGISRAYFILNHKNYLYAYSTSDGKEFSKQFLEFFSLLGLKKENLIHISETTQFRQIIVPDVSVIAGEYYTKEYTDVFKAITEKIKPIYNEKIYMQNTDYGKIKKYYGVSNIETFFQINGYTFIRPDRMSLKKQIALIKGCNQFACINGTLMHNMLFANDNTELIVINKTYLQNPYQGLIDSMKKLRVTYIDSYIALMPVTIGYGPFYLTISHTLTRFAKENGLKIPSYKHNDELCDYLKAWVDINLPRTIFQDIMYSKSIDELRNYYFKFINTTNH